MTATDQPSANGFGWSGVICAALGLLLASAIFWGGPFAPQDDAAVGIGKLAANIAKSAAREMVGAEQPAPQAQGWNIDRILGVAAAGLAALGIILGGIAWIREEKPRPAVAAVALGTSALAFHFLATVAALLIGAIIIGAIILALGGDILGG